MVSRRIGADEREAAARVTGQAIWVEPNDDPKRKLRYGWRLTELPGGEPGKTWAAVERLCRSWLGCHRLIFAFLHALVMQRR